MSVSGGHSHACELSPSGPSAPRPQWSWTSPGTLTRTTATRASIAASGVASARTATLTNAPGAIRSRGTLNASSVWFRSGETDSPHPARVTATGRRRATRAEPRGPDARRRGWKKSGAGRAEDPGRAEPANDADAAIPAGTAAMGISPKIARSPARPEAVGG